MTAPAPSRVPEPSAYWADTDLQIRHSTQLDRWAMRQVNSAHRLEHLEPFGSLPVDGAA